MKKYLSSGKIINTHGFRGTVKAEVWCDSPRVLANLKTVYLDGESPSPRAFSVLKASVMGKFVLLTLESIDTEEKANALRGTVLYADRNDIPLAPGAAFLADMIGLAVIDADTGVCYGTMINVEEGVASRIFEIQTPTGTVFMPDVKAFVDHIDTESGIYVRPIPGFFDSAAEEIRETEE